MTDELQEAHHELDRLQGIISRHEGYTFTIRGWLFAVVGGLLAAYYTGNIDINKKWVQVILPVIAVFFFVVEWRHINLVDAAVKRVKELEELIAEHRNQIEKGVSGWYKGPRVNDYCGRGANRWWPGGMTFTLNLPFYGVVILAIMFATLFLPSKVASPQPQPAHEQTQPTGIREQNSRAPANRS